LRGDTLIHQNIPLSAPKKGAQPLCLRLYLGTAKHLPWTQTKRRARADASPSASSKG